MPSKRPEITFPEDIQKRWSTNQIFLLSKDVWNLNLKPNFPIKTLKKPIIPSRESENLNFERFTLARFVH